MALRQTYLSYNGEHYSHFYLCHYLTRSAGRDTLSHSLLKFKLGRQPDLDGWIDCALEMLTNMPIPPGATLVRALHHNELAPPGTPAALDILGQELATRFHHCYQPRLLKKARPIPAVKTFGKPRREEELQGLYTIDTTYAATLPDGPPKHWLIIDDILTSGATIRAIIQAIHLPYPHTPISIFTLTRAINTTPTHSPETIQGHHYQLEQGKNWVLAEPPLPYYSLLQLKTMIRSDIFNF